MTRKPEDQTEQQPTRRPYKAPHLKHLGSVRELTLGKTGDNSEGAGTFIKNQGKGKG